MKTIEANQEKSAMIMLAPSTRLRSKIIGKISNAVRVRNQKVKTINDPA